MTKSRIEREFDGFPCLTDELQAPAVLQSMRPALHSLQSVHPRNAPYHIRKHAYLKRYTMASLATIEEFEAELCELKESARDAAAIIDALIEELGHDEEFLQTLVTDSPKWHWNYKPAFEFYRFQECWDEGCGRRIYSIKPYGVEGDLLPYRVFVAHDVQTDEYFALTIQPRESCYDTTTDAHRRLCARYDGLGIRPLRRNA